MKFKIVIIIIIYYYYYYFIPIYVATEHKSHSNLTTRTYKPEDNLNMNKTSEIYKIQHLDYTALTADPNLFARPRPTRDSYISLSCGHLSIGRCESRTRYLRDGKLIIGAAKLIDLDNYIKIFRGYFTKYIHASTLFLSTQTFQFESKCTSKIYEPPHY